MSSIPLGCSATDSVAPSLRGNQEKADIATAPQPDVTTAGDRVDERPKQPVEPSAAAVPVTDDSAGGDSATASGGAQDEQLIRRHIRAALPRINDCYEAQLEETPDAPGYVTVMFQIGPRGAVSSVTAEGTGEDVASCVTAVIENIRFPKQEGDNPVDVVYPFLFNPDDFRAGTTPHESKDGVVDTSDSYAAWIKIDFPTVTGGDLDPDVIRRHFNQRIGRIIYCYEKEIMKTPGMEGTVVATFRIGPRGAVSSSTVEGMGGDVPRCVGYVIENIGFPKPRDGKPVDVVYSFTLRPSGA